VSAYKNLTRTELIARLRGLESNPQQRSGQKGPKKRALSQTGSTNTAERLRAILDTAVEGIVTIDERGIIDSVNPAVEKLFGYTAAELIGKNVSILMPAPYRAEHDGYLDNYVRTGKAKVIGIGREVQGQRKDGTIFPMDLSVGEVLLPSGRLFTGIIRDITPRKELEKKVLEVSDREQRRIGQDLHDGLCQHLAGIELMSEALEQRLSAKSKSDAKRASDIARHVRESIRQTRLLARGLSPVDFEAGGLMSALQELAVNIQNLFRVHCSFVCPSPVLIQKNTLAANLFRIAQEAASNAVKHGRAQKIEILLRTSGGQIELLVRDYGRGFPELPAEGDGMGLRIMRYRAHMIGGNFEMTRQTPGTLVRCTVRLPTPSSRKNGN
jgi:two-component system sensor kinase FixL